MTLTCEIWEVARRLQITDHILGKKKREKKR